MQLFLATANANLRGIRLLGRVAKKIVCDIEFWLSGEQFHLKKKIAQAHDFQCHKYRLLMNRC